MMGADPGIEMGNQTSSRRLRHWRWIGIVAGVILLVWVLRDIEPARFLRVVETATIWPLLVIPAAVVIEQLVRAVKWRQIVHPVRPVGVWRLFQAIMAGYLANLAAPVRVSPLVRAWLVARLEDLSVGTLLATITLDRVIDGLVFVGFTVLALALASFPDTTGDIRAGLAWGGLLSLGLFCAVIGGLVALRRTFRGDDGPRWLTFLLGALPAKWREPVARFVRLFFAGVVWPAQAWRGVLVVGASVVMKLIAIGYFYWAGLAFGVHLEPQSYLFLMVFLGYLVILAGVVRLVGGFTAGAVFVLEGFGVEVERALAMALVVNAGALLTVAVAGALALWLQGFKLSTVLAAPEIPDDAPGDS